MTLPILADPSNAGNEPGRGPLRAGGQAPKGPMLAESNLPSTRSKASSRQMAALEMCRDLFAGTQKVRERSQLYLPQAPGEDYENYQMRLKRSVFHNFFRNTIQGLVGFMFREDPKLGEDVPERIVADWENIDLGGTHGDVFCREQETDAMQSGHNAILVEFPRTGGQQTAAQDGGRGGRAVKSAPIRPYWVPIRKEQILSWRTTVVDGRTVLSQVVIEECAMVPDGLFGEKEQKQYRVFIRTETGEVGFVLLEVMENKSLREIDRGSYPTQDEIPIAEIVTSGRRALFESEPPFLDLGYLNVAHYQQWSDYATSIHKTCVPLFMLAGVEEATGSDGQKQKMVLGPNTGIVTSNADAKGSYISHDGSALGACKASLDDLKNDMGALGLAALSSQKRAAETATAKELDKGASDSALSVNARGLQDGVERALYFHARYLQLESGGSIEINRNYGKQLMDAPMLTALTGLARDLGFPLIFVLERMQEGGLIPDGTDLDEIERQAMVIAAENEAREERNAADRAQQMQDKAA